MEAAAAWDGLCEFQLANWTTEEPVAGLPVEYASIDIPGACGLQEYEYDVQLQQHLVEYYSAASQHNIATTEKAKISDDDSHARSVVKEVLGKFEVDMKLMKHKMQGFALVPPNNCGLSIWMPFITYYFV
jgi:coproporphyrinogen III oxidase-like Fe-S oxidoreductase